MRIRRQYDRRTGRQEDTMTIGQRDKRTGEHEDRRRGGQ